MISLFEMVQSYHNVVYVRIKPGWLSVRIVRDGKRIGEYEDVPQIAMRERKDSRYEILAIGREAEQAMRQLGYATLCHGFDHPRVIFGNYEDTLHVLEQFVR